MYRRTESSWLKHIDFLILDILSLEAALVISYILRNGWTDWLSNALFRSTAIVVLLTAGVISFFTEAYRDVLRRGFLREAGQTALYEVIICAAILFYWYIGKFSTSYPRGAFGYFVILGFVFMYLCRTLRKKWLLSRNPSEHHARRMLLIAGKDTAEEFVATVTANTFYDIKVIGVVIFDEDMEGKEIGGIPVVANLADAAEYVMKNSVDEVFSDRIVGDPRTGAFFSKCDLMGVTVHRKLVRDTEMERVETVEKVAGYQVLSTSMNVITTRQLFCKRAIDICAGIVGCALTGILYIFLAPVIYISSPGPIFFKQTRVGKNGRKFTIYKFRSMYMDAEERKKELMEKNKMDGLMFKVDADPRIIGSGPDGTRHGVGWFIRRTSLDEFPQFYNILKGDMSLVGTRPPTVDEWEAYDLHHRARLAFRPGLTGMWQASGRSDITDFEEVVRLDTEYIRNWSLGLDIRLIFKTVGAVLTAKGSE
ncbi:MAG: sugar transferase [Lachnospiraceae bacterium]|nr:sugar transferase [Lachnospiraceae bacterium]